MQLKTVNVIEFFTETIQNVTAFSDNEEGNKEAEKLFSKMAKDNGFSKNEIKVGLEDGYLGHSGRSDDYHLFLTHSS